MVNTSRRRSPRRAICATVSVAAALTFLAACGDDSSSSSATGSGGECSKLPDGAIKLGDILPLSGATAQTTTATYDKLAVDYFNAHSDVCGHKFELVQKDDTGDPATALSLGRELDSDGIHLVLNSSTGPARDQLHAYFMKQGILTINSLSRPDLLDPKNNPTAFSYQPSIPQYAAVQVDWAAQKGQTKIAIMNDGGAFGESMTEYLTKGLADAGIETVGTFTYSGTAVDLTPQLTQAREAGAETVMLAGNLSINNLVTGMDQMGWDVPINSWGTLAYYGLKAADLPDGTTDGCQFAVEAGTPIDQQLSPDAEGLLKASEAEFGAGPQVPGVMNPYNGLLALKKAIVDANSIEGKDVAAALEKTSTLATVLPGLDFSFSSTNHTGWPDGGLKMCVLEPGDFNILKAAT